MRKYLIALVVFNFIFAVEYSYAEYKQVSVFDMPEGKADFERGKLVYNRYCLGCHGINGDGQGQAAAFLNPKPRNFKEVLFKFTSAPSGSLPTDQDLFKVITNGLHGSSMPSWRLLNEADRWSVVRYIKTFNAQRWESEGQNIVPTQISEDPFLNLSKEEAIKVGERAYHGLAACYSCHAGYISGEKINEARAYYKQEALTAFRTQLGESVAKEASDGSFIKPPDFGWDPIKNGTDLQSLYKIIANGISGTAMPTWKGVLSEEDIWGMAYYVQDMASRRPKLVSDAILAERKKKLADYEAQRIEFEKKIAQIPAAPVEAVKEGV